MMETTEIEKLTERLLLGPLLPDGTRQPGYHLCGFDVFPGDGPDVTAEQRAAAINRVFADLDSRKLQRLDHFPDDGPPPRDVRDVIAKLEKKP